MLQITRHLKQVYQLKDNSGHTNSILNLPEMNQKTIYITYTSTDEQTYSEKYEI